MYFEFHMRYVIMQSSFSEDIGHSSVLEMKKSAMGRTLTNQMEDGISKPESDD